MKYYILNINYDGVSEVDYWLGERGLAPIFYGKLGLATIKEKVRVDEELKREAGYSIGPQAYIDARRFVDVFSKINKEIVVFSIGNEYLYIFQQSGPLFESKENDEKYKNDLVKYFKINILKKVKIKDCPLVLVGIKANKHIQRGTFRDLNDERYLGNTRALEYLLSERPVVVENYARYLQCLSSLEFETFVAKYLEELGLFVPAYKGGFLKNYDLFCRNVGKHNIVVNKNIVSPNSSISVQIKLNLASEHETILDRVDLLFCINSAIKNDKICDWKFLESQIANMKIVKKWLETSLDWVIIKH